MKFTLLVFLLLASGNAFADTGVSPSVEFLKKLVSVSSGTADTSGVDAVQAIMAAELKALHFEIHEFKPDDCKVHAKQIEAVYAVQGKRFITLVGHADTVFEKLNAFEISADQKRIKGSGVGDDKGGLVVALSALRNYLKQHPKPNYSLRLVISPSEETGSMGYREKLHDFSKDSAYILGLEPAREDGSIVNARKGVRWYEISVEGREAHAGVNPEAGENACVGLASIVEKIAKLTDYKKGNTLSVGHIEGGKDKFNIVCGQASAKVDFRFKDLDSRDRIHTQVQKILNASKLKASYSIVTDVPPFPGSPKSKKITEQYLALVKKIESKTVQAVFTGGAGDLNYMSGGDALMLDGLGPVGSNFHTAEEYIESPSLDSRIEVLSQFLNSL